MAQTFISIVMPIYNEEKYIDNCIESLLLQDYPKVFMEWIFVDGQSEDRTCELIQKYAKKYPDLIYLLNNPNRTVPYAMNIGIKAAKGNYIIRLDAHADYAKDYISKCVYYLDTTDADNVGGAIETKSKGFVGNTIAKMLSSRFGVGNSEFRTQGNGYVDTVPFGAFRREVFEKYGMYDERLTRNQDNEMNFRIRKNGGKIYLAEDIHLSYYCRDTLKGITNMAKKNGTWNIITMRLCPGSMGIRHFIPFVFLCSIIILPFLSLLYRPFIFLFCCEMLIYILFDSYFSLKKADSITQFLLLLFIFPAFHLSYGFGSLQGLYKILVGQY